MFHLRSDFVVKTKLAEKRLAVQAKMLKTEVFLYHLFAKVD